DRTLDQTHSLGSLVGWAELSGVHQYGVPEILPREYFVHEADLFGLLERECLPFDHHFDCQGLADEPGDALGPAGAWQYPEIDFRQTDLAGVLAGQPEVTRHGDLEAAPHRVPVQCGDSELRGVLQPVQGLIGVKAEEVFEPWSDLLQHPDVSACG